VSGPEVVTALAKYLPGDRIDEAVQLLDDRQIAKLELMAREIRLISEEASWKPLENDAEEGGAAELLARGTAAVRELDALRRSRVDPLNAEVKAVNSLFRVITDPADQLVGKGGILERLLLAYRQVKRARIAREQEEQRRRQEEAARKEAEALAKAEAATNAKARAKALAEAEAASKEQAVALLDTPREMTRGTKTDSGTVSARERWVLQGIHDMDAIPPSYWRDEVVIEALKKVLQRAITAGERNIPGCSIGVEEGLTRRIG
jgi:hypothetical protein